jgi:hypothetical protein
MSAGVEILGVLQPMLVATVVLEFPSSVMEIELHIQRRKNMQMKQVLSISYFPGVKCESLMVRMRTGKYLSRLNIDPHNPLNATVPSPAANLSARKSPAETTKALPDRHASKS